MIVNTLTRLYNACLRLYPRNFHAEFAEEMQAVFSQAAREAYGESAFALGKLCLNELFCLPVSLLRAHSQTHSERRPSGALFQNNPLEQSGRELVLALVVFLLPAGMILAVQVPQASTPIGLPAAFLFLGVMVVIGWLGGFPLWSLPYVGVVLAITAYLYLFQWVAGLASPSLISTLSPGAWDRSTYLLLEMVSTGMLWLMLFCLTLLVVALLAIFNRFRPLLVRARQDWTILSYILYGESVFALLLLFESRHYDPNYAIASLLCLISGIWFYLRSPARWQRLLALLGCLTLAVGVAILEKWQLAPGWEWPFINRQDPSEAGRLLLTWIWMVVALLLPGLLTRLPSKPNPSSPTGMPRGGRLPSV